MELYKPNNTDEKVHATTAAPPENLPVGHSVNADTPSETGETQEQAPPEAPMQGIPTIPQLAIALGLLGVVLGASYLPFGTSGEAEHAEVPAAIPAAAERALPTIDSYAEVALTAKAAYVWDVREQRALYQKNASLELPLASLTKLMTALVAADVLDEDATVEITVDAIRQDGDSFMTAGERFRFADLAALTLVTSSNDGAYALAAAAGSALGGANAIPADTFVDAMNQKADEIRLAGTEFLNPTGLDLDERTGGAYGSARDIAFLMEYLVVEHPEVLAGTREMTRTFFDQAGLRFSATNTNEIVAEIPGLIGSKTGFTDLAGGNLVVAFDAGLNRPVVIAVLGSTREGRFSDVSTLVTHTQAALADK